MSDVLCVGELRVYNEFAKNHRRREAESEKKDARHENVERNKQRTNESVDKYQSKMNMKSGEKVLAQYWR